MSDRLKHCRAVGSFATALTDRGDLTERSQKRVENGVGPIEGLPETAMKSLDRSQGGFKRLNGFDTNQARARLSNGLLERLYGGFNGH